MTIYNHPELFWLALTGVFTSVLWAPYILQLIYQLGIVDAVWDPTGAHPHDADWALRAKRAHYNAVENLVVFGPLAIIVHLLELGNTVTAMACAVYFSARVAHFIIHTLAIPVIRTVVYLIGFGAQSVLALRVFGFI